MENGVSNYKLEPVLDESRARGKQLQAGLFSVEWEPASDTAKLFVVHKELRSRLHYGLLSNIGQGTLSTFLEDQEDVFSAFRDTFLDSDEGYVAGLIREMQEADKALLGCLVMVGFSAEQTVTTIQAFRHGKRQGVPASLEAFLRSAEPSEGLKRRLGGFRNLVGVGSVACFLLARIEPRISSENGRRRESVDLLGLGVLALQGGVAENEERLAFVAITAERWMETSRLATLTLFCERERYYEKAVRQAAQGWMLKWGKKADIEGQTAALAGLDEYTSHAVPPVLHAGNAPGATQTDPEVGWYQMPRYVMPSLGELLVRVEGFNRYELATLARATFQHLHSFFWRDLIFEAVTVAEGGTAGAIAGALTAACGARENARTVLRGFVEAATSRKPVVAFGKLRMLPPTEHSQLCSFWPVLLDGSARLSLRVEETTITLGSLPAADGLNALGQKIAHGKLVFQPGEGWAPAVALEGRIHGDAHLENFLVDASIPEDPFAVAIDIASVRELGTGWAYRPEEAGDLMRRWGVQLPRGRMDVLNRTQRDPSYDIAKLLLSATCWFGVVQRDAFAIEGGAATGWTLTADNASGPRASGNETAGVSGAEVLRLVAPIGPTVWNNHREVAKALLREYVALLQMKAKGLGGPISPVGAVNLSLLRTYFFLIRHVFSIATRLFLSRPTNAAVMFAIGEHSASEINRLLATEPFLESERLTAKLVARLADLVVDVQD